MKRIIDLSHGIYHNCPGYFPYELTSVKYETIKAKDGYTSERLYLNSHTATHVDAPYHHYPDGLTIEQMPLDLFCGDALFLDFDGIEAHKPITKAMLKQYDDKIKKDDIVLIRTGVGQRRGWTKEYCDFYCFLSVDAAEYLLDKGIKGVAMDTLSVGGPKPGDGALEVHELLLKQNIWLGEEFFLPDELKERERWFVVVAPLKLDGCGGAPARAMAIEL